MTRRCAAATAAALCRSASTAPSRRSASASSRRSTCRGPAERTGKRGSTPCSAPSRRFTINRCRRRRSLRQRASPSPGRVSRRWVVGGTVAIAAAAGGAAWWTGLLGAGDGECAQRRRPAFRQSQRRSCPRLFLGRSRRRDSRPARPQPAASCRRTDVVQPVSQQRRGRARDLAGAACGLSARRQCPADRFHGPRFRPS